MSAKHTQEPWRIGDEESGLVAIDGPVGELVTGWIDPEEAQRIIACVNACAGISTETLERHGMIPVSALEQQRDELLAALRMVGLLRQLGGMLPDTHEIVQMVVEAADEAISKVEAAK